MTLTECALLVAVAAVPVGLAVWAVRGARREDGEWFRRHRATCPLDCCRD